MTSSPPPPPVDSTGAGENPTQGESRIFPCAACGADLQFGITAQSLQCPYCGHVKQLEVRAAARVEEQDLRAMLQTVADQRSGGENTLPGISEVGCRDCGAKVRFHGTLTSSECPYCGTPIQLDGVHDAEDRIAVDGVLPFKIERQAAQKNLEEWVQSRWFAPSAFKQRGVKGRFSGVYMPYWTYDAMTLNDYHGERGEHYYVTVKRGDQEVRERRTRWYPTSGSFRRFFDDVLVVAGEGLSTKVVGSLEPWPLHECVPFNQQVLAGFLARTYDLPLQAGFSRAKTRIEAAVHADVGQRIGGDEQRIHSVNTDYGALTYKHVLLPVWILAYKYGEKTYQIVVNAATGEVQGERPYSWIKITLFVLTILSVVATIVFFVNR